MGIAFVVFIKLYAILKALHTHTHTHTHTHAHAHSHTQTHTHEKGIPKLVLKFSNLIPMPQPGFPRTQMLK